MPAKVAPVPGRPALRVAPGANVPPFVVLADVHLGLGTLGGGAHGPPSADPVALAADAVGIARQAGVAHLIFAGDVKHPIVGGTAATRRAVLAFFESLRDAGLTTEVVLGNHDVGLAGMLPPEVRVHPPTGLVRAGLGIFHGHRWPSREVLAQPTLVAGHLHPGFRMAPSAEAPGAKQRCWVRTRFPPAPAPRGRRRSPRRFAAAEMLVLPAFHPLSGTESLNRSRPSRGRSFLFGRFLAFGESRLYLLDGTDLGPLTPRMGRSGPDGARRGR